MWIVVTVFPLRTVITYKFQVLLSDSWVKPRFGKS